MSGGLAGGTTSSPYQETAFFEEDWKQCGGGDFFDGLAPIADFNANFEGSNGGECIDPQLLSDLSSPSNSQIPLFNATGNEAIETDQSRCPEETPNRLFGESTEHAEQIAVTSFESSFADTAQPVMASFEENVFGLSHGQQESNMQYFHPSIEQPGNNTMMQPQMLATQQQAQQIRHPTSLLRHQLHRRSVSEPPTGPGPDDFQHHHYQPPPGAQAPMYFHRQGYTIGKPQPQPRAKRGRPLNRQQPYPSSAQEATMRRHRHEMKRAQTQPMRAPTSMPVTPSPQRHDMHALGGPAPPLMYSHQPVMMPNVNTNVQMSPAKYVSSRVCTPTPSPERMVNASAGYEGDMSAIANGLSTPEEKKATLVIPMTVEELRTLITEVVQKSLQESDKEDTVPTEAVVCDGDLSLEDSKIIREE